MTNPSTRQAAQLLAGSWMIGQHLDELPPHLRPQTLDEGRAVQALWAEVTGDTVAGWKIAATSPAGQQHIGLSGPIAGPVFARHVQADGATLALAGNRMRVAECEIVFRLGRSLPPRAQAYTRDEVLAAVQSLHPGIEAPDSRFRAFERAGQAQLIADCACTNDMVVGAAVAPDQRVQALPGLLVQARVSDGRAPQGLGSLVLGDPVEALRWLVNELSASGRCLEAGQFVTTGACVPPIPLQPGQRVEADFGWIGRIAASFA
jgi:2-keto-4-pentenoate hydratase